jgi:hypothetical protein
MPAPGVQQPWPGTIDRVYRDHRDEDGRKAEDHAHEDPSTHADRLSRLSTRVNLSTRVASRSRDTFSKSRHPYRIRIIR